MRRREPNDEAVDGVNERMGEGKQSEGRCSSKEEKGPWGEERKKDKVEARESERGKKMGIQ